MLFIACWSTKILALFSLLIIRNMFYFYFFNTVIELLNVNKPEPDLNTSF